MINVNVAPDGAVISAGNRFLAQIAPATAGQNPRKTGLEAAEVAAGRLKLHPKQPFSVLGRRGGASQATTLSDAGIASRPIEAQLVWLPIDGGVRLAWRLEIEELGGAHWWYAFVDAVSGASLGEVDLMVRDSAAAIAAAVARPAGTEALLPAFR